jgi:hypothetical protein
MKEVDNMENEVINLNPTISVKELEEMMELSLKFKPLIGNDKINMLIKYGPGEGIFNALKNIKNDKFEVLTMKPILMFEQQDVINYINELLITIDPNKEYYILVDEFDNAIIKINACIQEMLLWGSVDGFEAFKLPHNLNFILMGHGTPNLSFYFKNHALHGSYEIL